MVELRKSQEVSQNKFDEERREWLRDMRAVQECKAQVLLYFYCYWDYIGLYVFRSNFIGTLLPCLLVWF